MKDISHLLLKKEQDILRVRKEIEALRFVIPLLADENPRPIAQDDPAPSPIRGNRWPLEIPRSR